MNIRLHLTYVAPRRWAKNALHYGNISIAAGTGRSSAATVAAGRAAVLLSFIATCKRCGVEPFAWFRDVLTRIASHSVQSPR